MTTSRAPWPLSPGAPVTPPRGRPCDDLDEGHGRLPAGLPWGRSLLLLWALGPSRVELSRACSPGRRAAVPCLLLSPASAGCPSSPLPTIFLGLPFDPAPALSPAAPQATLDQGGSDRGFVSVGSTRVVCPGFWWGSACAPGPPSPAFSWLSQLLTCVGGTSSAGRAPRRGQRPGAQWGCRESPTDAPQSGWLGSRDVACACPQVVPPTCPLAWLCRPCWGSLGVHSG